jgi:drug/metabolite transporter superfamily protein YnfA
MANVGQMLVMLVAAALEVIGDALIRKGLRGSGLWLVAVGFIDFSRLLGAYVGFFAIVSVSFGRFVFKEQVPTSTWLGLGVVLAGSLIIQLGGASAVP